LILVNYYVQLFRHGKYHVEIGRIENILFSIMGGNAGFDPLAHGAVPIPAGIISDLGMAACFTFIGMST
jgi:hypothetical protein